MMESETGKLKERIYNLADTIQRHELMISGCNTRIDGLVRQIENLQATSVSRELLNTSVGAVMIKTEYMHSENTLKFEHFDTKLDNIKDSIDPLRKAINWAIAIIVSGFLAGLLALVWKG